MSFPLGAKQWFSSTTPKSTTLIGTYTGTVLVVQTSATPSYISLASLFTVAANAAIAGGGQPNGVTNQRIEIYADTSSLGIIFGPTVASVSTSPPIIADYGSLTAGIYTANGSNAECMVIPAATYRQFNLQASISAGIGDLYLGFVASGSGLLRLYQCNSSNP